MDNKYRIREMEKDGETANLLLTGPKFPYTHTQSRTQSRTHVRSSPAATTSVLFLYFIILQY